MKWIICFCESPNIGFWQLFTRKHPKFSHVFAVQYFPELKRNTKVDFCDIDLFNKIQNKHFNPRGMNPHPSLGLQGINLIANKYPDYQIYITGFDSFNSDKIHYMDKIGVNDTHVKHNLDKEIKFLKYLVKKYNINKI